VKELRVDGGASANDLLMQFQADLLGMNVLRPRSSESTALGAGYLAGLAVGFWRDVDELAQQWRLERRFTPALPRDAVARHLAGWQRAIGAAKAWADAGGANEASEG